MVQYPTTLDDDIRLLGHVEANEQDYHWMYQYILIYRISLKKILAAHIDYSSQVLNILAQTNSDRYDFCIAV